MVPPKQQEAPLTLRLSKGLPACWGLVLTGLELFLKPLADVVADYTGCDSLTHYNAEAPHPVKDEALLRIFGNIRGWLRNKDYPSSSLWSLATTSRVGSLASMWFR